jgi:fibrillarin-like rRNA methylase
MFTKQTEINLTVYDEKIIELSGIEHREWLKNKFNVLEIESKNISIRDV